MYSGIRIMSRIRIFPLVTGPTSPGECFWLVCIPPPLSPLLIAVFSLGEIIFTLCQWQYNGYSQLRWEERRTIIRYSEIFILSGNFLYNGCFCNSYLIYKKYNTVYVHDNMNMQNSQIEVEQNLAAFWSWNADTWYFWNFIS